MSISRWVELSGLVREAVAQGWLADKRRAMPKAGRWPVVGDPALRLGMCVHQSASPNTTDPLKTAAYHTSPDNHITPGRPLPGLCYHFAITDDTGPVWLCSNLDDRLYSQGSATSPGDENTHLLSVLVMGAFEGVGWHPPYARARPSMHQFSKLAQLTEWLKKVFGFDGSGVFAHCFFGKAACPGHALTAWVEQQRQGASADREHDTSYWQACLDRWKPGCLGSTGVDGMWGQASQAALVSFQRWRKVEVTGMLDPFTRLMLRRQFALGEPVA